MKDEAREKLEIFVAHGADTNKLRKAFHGMLINPSAEYDMAAAKAAGDAELDAILAEAKK